MEETTFNYSERRKIPYLRFPQVSRLPVFSAKSLILSCPEESQNSLNANCGATSHIPEEELIEGSASRASLKQPWRSSLTSTSSDSGPSPGLDWCGSAHRPGLNIPFTSLAPLIPYNLDSDITTSPQFSLRSLHSQVNGFANIFLEGDYTQLY